MSARTDRWDEASQGWSPESGAWSPESGARSLEPRARRLEPGTQSPKPGAWSPEPRAWSPEPGTQSPEPRARSPEFGAQSPEPGARSPEPGSRDRVCMSSSRQAFRLTLKQPLSPLCQLQPITWEQEESSVSLGRGGGRGGLSRLEWDRQGPTPGPWLPACATRSDLLDSQLAHLENGAESKPSGSAPQIISVGAEGAEGAHKSQRLILGPSAQTSASEFATQAGTGHLVLGECWHRRTWP